MNWLQQLAEWIRGLKCWYIVRPWEQAIRVRCGRWIASVEPGLHIRIPFLDEVFIQNVRVRVLNLPVQTVTSKAGITVTLSAVVCWRISDVQLIYEKVHNPEDWIYNVTLSTVASAVFDADRSVTPKQIGEAATRGLIDAGELGMEIQSVAITDFAMVRTYRLISGEGNTGWSWSRVGSLETATK